MFYTGFEISYSLKKCKTDLSEIKYLENIINEHDINPDPAKIQSVIYMPPPHEILHYVHTLE